jgi:hypothetical protein
MKHGKWPASTVANNLEDKVMPRVADYGIITDGKITLTSTAPGDFQEVKFNLDSPHVGSRSILAFNLDLVDADDFKFNVKVNGTQVFNARYSGGDFFTIHEVIDANLLHAQGNVIQFKATSSNSGSVRIADIVLWYQHDI